MFYLCVCVLRRMCECVYERVFSWVFKIRPADIENNTKHGTTPKHIVFFSMHKLFSSVNLLPAANFQDPLVRQEF